jgi:hypothetical protein
MNEGPKTKSTDCAVSLARALAIGALAGVACYPHQLVGGGVKSVATVQETQVVPFWGVQGAAVTECKAGIHSVSIDEPWYGNLLRLVTLGIVGTHRVQIVCNEQVEAK